jgi:hypothetical protein
LETFQIFFRHLILAENFDGSWLPDGILEVQDIVLIKAFHDLAISTDTHLVLNSVIVSHLSITFGLNKWMGIFTID